MTESSTERAEVLFADFDALNADRLVWAAGSDLEGVHDTRDALVRRAVRECLTEKQREVVTAYFFEGRSQSEIARALGVRQQVVQKRIFGTRRRGQVIGGALKRLAAFLTPRLHA